MKRSFVSTLAVLGCISMLVSSCATSGYKVIDKSGSKEKWVKTSDVCHREKQDIFCRGEVSNVYDLALGKRQAEADALKRVVEMVRRDVLSEYRQYTRGANAFPGDVGQFVEDVIQSTSEVSLSGLMVRKSYWQTEANEEGSRPHYHIYALVQLSNNDYESAKSQIVDALMSRAKLDKNEEAERFLDEWRKLRGK